MNNNTTLTPRQIQALQMRREGKKLREISQALRVSIARAHELIERAELMETQASWTTGLPAAVASTLLTCGIRRLAALREAIENGSLRRMPGIGPRRYETIVQWVQHK